MQVKNLFHFQSPSSILSACFEKKLNHFMYGHVKYLKYCPPTKLCHISPVFKTKMNCVRRHTSSHSYYHVQVDLFLAGLFSLMRTFFADLFKRDFSDCKSSKRNSPTSQKTDFCNLTNNLTQVRNLYSPFWVHKAHSRAFLVKLNVHTYPQTLPLLLPSSRQTWMAWESTTVSCRYLHQNSFFVYKALALSKTINNRK